MLTKMKSKITRKLIMALVTCTISLCLVARVQAANYYVATSGNDGWPGTIDEPFATLERARDAIRELKSNGPLSEPVNVYLRGGTYELESPFVLEPADSGTSDNPITYQAYNCEEVTISGGKQLNFNWQPYSEDIYVADVSGFINQYGPFNSLFVNERRAIKARMPNKGDYFNIAGVDDETEYEAFSFFDGDINPNWRNLQDIEIATNIRFYRPRLKIKEVIGNKVFFNVNLVLPFSEWNYDWWPYYVDNVFEGLSEGEWYLDRYTNELYYWPLPGEDIYSSEIIAPVIEQLLQVANVEGWSEGIIGSALEFSGLGENLFVKYVEILDSKDFQFENKSITLTAWIKMSKVNQDDQYPMVFHKGKADAGRVILRFDGQSNSPKLRFIIWQDGTQALNLATSKTDWVADQWYYITAVYNNATGEAEIYVDGNREGSKSPGLGIIRDTSSGFLGIGNSQSTVDTFFNGTIDEPRVYTRALSEEEIQQQYQDYTTGVISDSPEEGLVGYWKFDEASGKIVGDSSGKENNGYYHGLSDFGDCYLTFKGITFSYTDYEFPDWRGYRGIWYGRRFGKSPIKNPAIFSYLTNNFRFINNTLSHIGGTGLYASAINSRIGGNYLYDLGASGIILDDATGDDNINISAQNIISHNKVHDVGILFNAVGISLRSNKGNATVSHNLVYNTPYIGIHHSPFGDLNNQKIIIEFNETYDVMKELIEGAGIYTVHGMGTAISGEPNIIIRNNLVHDVHRTNAHINNTREYGHFGIYLDNESNSVHVLNNLVYDTFTSGLMLHESYNNLINNNIFIAAERYQLALMSQDMHGNNFSNNIVYNPSNNNYLAVWKEGALDSSDYNLYYNPENKYIVKNFVDNSEVPFDVWKETHGFDQNSLIADPLLADYKNDDLPLQTDSPAFGLGFQEIDMSQVGPQLQVGCSSCTGDANLDGLVNIVDILTCVNHVIGIAPIPEASPEFLNANIAGDDQVINILDIVAIVNVILGG